MYSLRFYSSSPQRSRPCYRRWKRWLCPCQEAQRPWCLLRSLDRKRGRGRLVSTGFLALVFNAQPALLSRWLHRTPLFSLHHLSDGKHSTVFPSTHDEQLDRPVTLITGRGLGGSTRINGGQYICGVPGEYNAWAQAGNIAWSYEELKVFFKRSKKWLGTVSREFHGTEGER